MKTLLTALVATALALPALVATAAPASEDADTLYALGASVAKGLAPFQLTPAEAALVAQGMTDALAGKARLDPASKMAAIQAMAEARGQALAAATKAKGAAFLAQAAKAPGARQTASGLVYQELKAGQGTPPTLENTVTVHYKGTLIDGTEFDSSYSRGEPTSFPLGRVVPCWREGVALMKPGGKAKLVCPADLAYGDRGAGEKIKPGATLVFEVELLEVKAGG